MEQARPVNVWHAMEGDAVARALDVQPASGLSAEEASRRLTIHGANALRERRRRHPLRLLLSQFADVMVLVLLAAALVAGSVGEWHDVLAIAVIVILNAILGFVQEYRAERALEALQALAAPLVRVRRDAAMCLVPSASLVPGDVVALEAGTIVAADLRLTQVHHLRVDESVLTGESVPIDKAVHPLAADDATLGDRRNMAYRGTVATYGRGEGIVVGTGMSTELGRLAGLLEAAEETRTPLQRRLRRFATRLAIVVLAICAGIFGIGLLRGEPPLLMFLTALSLAVAAMPEALPAVVTVSLALGARRLVARHALVRRLPAVETLGSVTCICTDKTGTLTRNEMRVARVHLPGDPQATEPALALARAPALRRAMALNADVSHHPGRVHGDPTEVALLERALEGGAEVAPWLAQHARLAELPFSSERGRMSTVHRDDAGAGAASAFLVMKGAPEQVLPRCTTMRVGDDVVPVDAPALRRAADAIAADGLRVLAFASRPLDPPGATTLDEGVEVACTCLGLVGLHDPPRDEVPAAIAECATAGVRVIMITGDHPATALAIARAVGIEAGPEALLTGEQFTRLDDEALRERARTVSVYARVAPEQKIRIVRALQARGAFVAMTGDGVNDAPAIRQADIGIAMGRGGTDVAREAADMVLVDDNFATIVAAVREGRRIYDNIRKFIRYVLTGNSAEIWVLFLAPLIGMPLPLLPLHILWINLVTDGLPGLALSAEPVERDVMRRPPRPPNESAFAHGLWQHALWVGLVMAGVTLGTQAWALHAGNPRWQGMTFTVLALSQLGHVLAVRSVRDSCLRRGGPSNRALTAAVIGTAVLQLTILYVPSLAAIFRLAPLTMGELLACVALAAVVPLAVEVEKWGLRRGLLYGEPPG